MAKPRKQKPNGDGDSKPDSASGGGAVSGGAVTVVHQKICLSVDMENRCIHGYTELKVLLSEGDNLALHADNMTIRNITVDGKSAEFKHTPHWISVSEENSWSTASCSKAVADIACSTYVSFLSMEAAPNLLITCESSMKFIDKQGNRENDPTEVQSSTLQEADGCNGSVDLKVQDVKLIHIDYILERAETGVHFTGNVLHTNSQIMRAHCWFPCIETTEQRCTYDLEFTVDRNLVALSNGALLYQVLGKDDSSRKTFVYKLTVPVCPRWISLVVGPFEILPDSHNSSVTHMCLSPDISKLRNTVGFFNNAYRYYEEYLSAPFPFGSYKQVFLPSEIMVSSTSLGASTCIFSADILYDEKIIDQTIETRIKIAYALARQWFGVFIVPEEPSDEWLLDGLAGFLTDNYTKSSLGNNEARYRRFKANCTVCKVDVSGTTSLNSSAATSDLYGTHTIGFYGKVRSWKALAVLQMLEKQMGPDSFKKILQLIISRAVGDTNKLRTLSSKEFRHLANKVGNLERPFLKEFFPQWIESYGCPLMRMAVSYNKRRNMIELAVFRGCTAQDENNLDKHPDNDVRDIESGWPGMMSIRVNELDGVYDHPILPMSGDNSQVVEIQCNSRLAAKRTQKSKKGSKADGSDDNADMPSPDRPGMDSPLLWIRVDPEMEYLAEIHFYQPIQMWINQLEKDKDVVAQSQAIAMLVKQPQLPVHVINALNNFLADPKAFWRVRVEAAYALAVTASEETDLLGLRHLKNFYKDRRFDANIGLPRPNDFQNLPEYFVLEAIPHAVALVKAADKKTPRDAIEFVLQMLKYNDNNGNTYSDVFWLSAMVQAVGELELSQQDGFLLASLLKRIDRLLQFDSYMPTYNGVLTVSCIRTLTRVALKMASFLSLARVCDLIKPFCSTGQPWKIRIEACKMLLDLEYHHKGFDAAISLFLRFLEGEKSLRGGTKLAAHIMRLCQANFEPSRNDQISRQTLFCLLRCLASRKAYNNVYLRHHLFCIMQIAAGRSPTLYGYSKRGAPSAVCSENDGDEHARIVAVQTTAHEPPIGITAIRNDMVNNSQPNSGSLLLPSVRNPEHADVLATNYDTLTAVSQYGHQPKVGPLVLQMSGHQDSLAAAPNGQQSKVGPLVLHMPKNQEVSSGAPNIGNPQFVDILNEQPRVGPVLLPIPRSREPSSGAPISLDVPAENLPKDAENVSSNSDRKRSVLKIRVKNPSSSSKADDVDNQIAHSQGARNDNDIGTCSSMSVDAPVHAAELEPPTMSALNIEEVNSSHDRESRMSVSASSSKVGTKQDIPRELQCTADSKEDTGILSLDHNRHPEDPGVSQQLQTPATSNDLTTSQHFSDNHGSSDKKNKKDREKKRRREDKPKKDDPEYLEKKRLKKEKKRMEKMANKQKGLELLQNGPADVSQTAPLRPVPEIPTQATEPAPSNAGRKLRIKVIRGSTNG